MKNLFKFFLKFFNFKKEKTVGNQKKLEPVKITDSTQDNSSQNLFEQEKIDEVKAKLKVGTICKTWDTEDKDFRYHMFTEINSEKYLGIDFFMDKIEISDSFYTTYLLNGKEIDELTSWADSILSGDSEILEGKEKEEIKEKIKRLIQNQIKLFDDQIKSFNQSAVYWNNLLNTFD